MKNDHLQMKKCPRCGTPEGFDRGRNCGICGLQIRTEEEYKQWLAYHGVSPEQSEPKAGEPTTVTVLGEQVRFPRICPHCLADASVPLRLESNQSGTYIVIGVLWRYHTIYAPFCPPFAKKIVRIHRLWNACVILAIVLAPLAAVFFHFSKPQFWLTFILVVGGPLIAQLYWNANKYIRITGVQKDSIEFSIANPIYAQEFRRLNATDEVPCCS
jgi:hypothetical protein